jgi:hypothetical protein
MDSHSEVLRLFPSQFGMFSRVLIPVACQRLYQNCVCVCILIYIYIYIYIYL